MKPRTRFSKRFMVPANLSRVQLLVVSARLHQTTTKLATASGLTPRVVVSEGVIDQFDAAVDAKVLGFGGKVLGMFRPVTITLECDEVPV